MMKKCQRNQGKKKLGGRREGGLMVAHRFLFLLKPWKDLAGLCSLSLHSSWVCLHHLSNGVPALLLSQSITRHPDLQCSGRWISKPSRTTNKIFFGFLKFSGEVPFLCLIWKCHPSVILTAKTCFPIANLILSCFNASTRPTHNFLWKACYMATTL